jgi:hypothetical protein
MASPQNEKDKIAERFCQPLAYKFSLSQHTKSHQKRMIGFIREMLGI